MRKTLKRVLSTALAGLMLASTATIVASANSGEKTLYTFQQACEMQWNKDLGEIETVEYMFYMPNEWKNEYNDYYNSADENPIYSAGIYWWDSTASPGEFVANDNDWPGYAVTKTAEDCSNVYIAEVPANVPTVVWNNSVNGGTDNTQPWYTAAKQSVDAGVCGYDEGMDTYGFYPDGLESMAGMIYVCNPADTTLNPASQKESFRGEWFYYYGNGEYGTAPTREEAGEFVYKDGVFPPTGVTFSTNDIKVGIGGTVTGVASKDNAEGKIEDETIAKVEKAADGTFTVTGLAEGKTTLVISSFNDATKETNEVTVPVEIVIPSFDTTSMTMKVGETAENIGYYLGENVEYSYSTKGIVEYDGIEVTAKKAGSTTVNCTQGGKTYSFKVTVKASLSINAKSKKLGAGKTYTLKVKGGKATFKSSNSKVAKVDKRTGKVTALKKGSATITATVGKEKLTCKITVTSNPKLSAKTANTKIKKSKTVKITGAASSGDVKVSKCKYAKITKSKTKLTIKGTKKGSQTVTVTVNGVKLKLKVTVKK